MAHLIVAFRRSKMEFFLIIPTYQGTFKIHFVGGLKYAFGAQAFARLDAAVSDPFTATDTAIAPYADDYLEYDTNGRVTKRVAGGEGCSACSGGLGEYTYSYSDSGYSLAGT